MAQNEEYELSHVLQGHTLDVRGLATCENPAACVVSASRDCTAKLWQLDSFHPEPIHTYKGHDKYVSCVCVLPASPEHPPLILTGSNDHTICAFSMDSGEIVYKLTGHKNAVCCLWTGSGDRVMSSSWDSTARVWQGQVEVAVLQGHEASVWSVIDMPGGGQIVTASADKTIKVWTEGTCDATLQGHEDCVRGLAPVSSSEFVSCANDASVRLWRISGECLGIFYGHTSFVYSISALPGGGFVSCGEDHCVRVWRADGETSQVIPIPAQSVWCVVTLASGDIAAGSSDGQVRVFSRDESRQAGEDSLATYSEEVSCFTKTSKLELGGVKVNDLPGQEVLYAPGKEDGQTKMVREGDKVICYQWSAAKQEWDCIGEAVGAKPESSEGRTSYKGKEYDLVFSVDIEDGKPPLKLPYNRGDDPWVAAQKFIHDNDLSQMFLDTVANFIVKNSGGGDSGPSTAGGSAQYVDPFTGGSRYVPGGAGGAQGGRPAAVPNADPFTGNSSYTSMASRHAQAPNLTIQKEYHLFEQGNVEKVIEKLQEFNKESIQPLTEEQVAATARLADLEHTPSEQEIHAIHKMLTWSSDRLFPVLDLARLAVRNPHVNDSLCSEPYSPLLLSSVLRPNLTPQTPELTRLMALRLVTNMQVHDPGKKLAAGNAEYLVSVATQLSLPTAQPPPRQQVALSTLLFNLSVSYIRGYSELQKIATPMTILVLQRLTDAEAQKRCLGALSNLLDHASPELLTLARDKKLPETLATLIGEPKVAELAGKILAAMP